MRCDDQVDIQRFVRAFLFSPQQCDQAFEEQQAVCQKLSATASSGGGSSADVAERAYQAGFYNGTKQFSQYLGEALR